MSIPISQFIPPPPHPWLSPLHVHTFVLYICVSISALQTGSSVPFFYIPHICVNIWYLFCTSDLLHSVWRSVGPSMPLQMTQFHSFLWLGNIPLYICTTSSLSIHPICFNFLSNYSNIYVNSVLAPVDCFFSNPSWYFLACCLTTNFGPYPGPLSITLENSCPCLHLLFSSWG